MSESRENIVCHEDPTGSKPTEAVVDQPGTEAAVGTNESAPRHGGDEEEDTTRYRVVVNQEEQYSIWPSHRENPLGWRDAGQEGLKKECLAFINEVWTDMRPVSLRRKMAQGEREKPEWERRAAALREKASQTPPDPRDNLVEFLCTGSRPVEIGLRPEKSAKLFEKAVERGYGFVKFIDTRGGTELGVRLDRNRSDVSGADFSQERGRVHLEGDLSLNYVPVRCVADIDLSTLTGTGCFCRREK